MQYHCGLRSSFIVHFTSTTPPMAPGGSTVRNFYVKFNLLGLGCNHAVLEQLEAKNLSKRAMCCQKSWTLDPHGVPRGVVLAKLQVFKKFVWIFLADSAPWWPCVNFENDPLSLLLQSPSQKLNESVIKNSKNWKFRCPSLIFIASMEETAST